MKHFKVQKGYNNDFVEIDETELEKAINAQVTGKVAFFKRGGTVSGNHIISVEPDFDKMEKVYNPSGPDVIPNGLVDAHYLAIENAGETVKAAIENRRPVLKELPNPSVRKFTQGPTALGDLLEDKV